MNTITTTLETITPSKAAKYLEANTANRRIRPTWVKKLAGAISDGRWRVTHQGIAFNCDGTLIDGQHRLQAIVSANKAVKMLVTRGMEKQTILAIDQGGGRDVVDITGPLFLGTQVTKKQVATARQMDTGITRGGFRADWSNEQWLDYVIKHLEAINYACGLLTSKDVSHAVFRAVVARAWYHEDRERLAQFCAVLNTGITEGKQDGTAAMLRSIYLKHRRTFNGIGGRSVLYRKSECALRAFLERRPLTYIQEVQQECWPLPNEGA